MVFWGKVGRRRRSERSEIFPRICRYSRICRAIYGEIYGWRRICSTEALFMFIFFTLLISSSRSEKKGREEDGKSSISKSCSLETKPPSCPRYCTMRRAKYLPIPGTLRSVVVSAWFSGTVSPGFNFLIYSSAMRLAAMLSLSVSIRCLLLSRPFPISPSLLLTVPPSF